LPGIYKRLKDHVVALPGPDRPIIGKLNPDNPTDAIDVKWKVAEFLLAPLLSQEEEFGTVLLPEAAHDNSDQAMIRRMRSLGAFWQDSLVSFLAG
jgi:hypothetical protein